MNIALVVLDTLRHDAFEQHFGWLSGTRIENVWAPSYWTVPSHAALFTGRYPSEIGVHAKNTTLDCPDATLAESLADAGYTTRAFSNNVNLTPLSSFDRGFEHFDGGWRVRSLTANAFDWETFVSETRDEGPARYLRALRQCVAGECATWPSLKRGARLKLRDLGLAHPPADNGAQETLEYVRGTEFGDREFLFVNLMESHWPYRIPDSFSDEDAHNIAEGVDYNGLVATLGDGPPVDGERLRHRYDESVAYLSAMYERIFEELDENFDVIVTVSDHGELFGEGGGWQHACGIRPELTHVPTVVSGGGSEITDETDSQPSSLLDVHRTILALAGSAGSSNGRILPCADDDSSASEDRRVFVESHGLNQRSVARARAEGLAPASLDHELAGVATSTVYGYENDGEFVVAGPTRDTSSDMNAASLKQSIEAHRERVDSRDVSKDDGAPEALQNQLEALGYA